MMPLILLRPARKEDLDDLWAFLAIAAYEPDAATARGIPAVAVHLADWKRECDFGYVAEMNGRPAGAAWARQFAAHEEPTFFVDDRTPEVSIGVGSTMRGKGIGEALLGELILESKRRGVGLCLNVRDSNPAVRLYERVGFRRVPGTEVKNRTGGLSFGMQLRKP
jgi:ribosomal protein S18 acetylase RimI-like enzyme